jgi:hypothetical protein
MIEKEGLEESPMSEKAAKIHAIVQQKEQVIQGTGRGPLQIAESPTSHVIDEKQNLTAD